MTVSQFLNRQLRVRPASSLQGTDPGGAAKRARLPSYAAGKMPSLGGVNVQFQDGVVDMASNTTASLPMMIRPYSTRYERLYTPGLPLFVHRSEVGHLHTVADVATINWYLRAAKHMVTDPKIASLVKGLNTQGNDEELQRVKAGLMKYIGETAEQQKKELGVKLKNLKSNSFLSQASEKARMIALVAKSFVTGFFTDNIPETKVNVDPALKKQQDAKKREAEIKRLETLVKALEADQVATADILYNLMKNWGFQGVLRGEIGAGSLQKLYNIDVFGRSSVANYFGDNICAGQVVGFALVLKNLLQVEHCEPNGAPQTVALYNNKTAVNQFQLEGMTQEEFGTRSDAKQFIPLGVVVNSMGCKKDNPSQRRRAHVCSHDATSLPRIEVLLM